MSVKFWPLLLLAACQPKHAEWQDVCTASHTEVMFLPQFIPDGKGGGMTSIQPTYYDQCDSYKQVCIPGSDGSHDCGPSNSH